MIYVFNQVTAILAPYRSIFHLMRKAVPVQKRQVEFKECSTIDRCFCTDFENRECYCIKTTYIIAVV
jgi:hypothetical protein